MEVMGICGPSYTGYLFDKRSKNLLETKKKKKRKTLSKLTDDIYLGCLLHIPKRKLLHAYGNQAQATMSKRL